MLTSVQLDNFRCFKKHEVDLRSLTIIVGANNAGKSTLVEALRLIALVANRYRHLTYHSPPDWTDLASRFRGVNPSTRDLDLRGGSVFHRYGDPPAIITGSFSTGSTVEVLVGPDNEVFGIVRDANGIVVTSKQHANRVTIPSISILPQIGPVADAEAVLSDQHVLRSIDSNLASRHFRNQLNLFYIDHFDDFRQRAEESWPGLRLDGLDGHAGMPNAPLNLFIRDTDFVAEIAWMGHGLQMWLQTMWFLSRARDAATIILDEPDVYMHADLQRRLIRLLRERDRQTIVATHSVEVMAEVAPDQILIVDRKKKRSAFASSVPAVQRVIDSIGGVHNIHLARLWSSRKVILIEGKDVQILKLWQDRLFPRTDTPFDILPRFSLGGWGGWHYAIGSTRFLQNAAGDEITPYCIFDSDYHTPDEIEERYSEASEAGVELHVWARKEVENYLLVPLAIARVIASEARPGVRAPTCENVANQMNAIADGMRDQVFDALAHEYLARDRAGGVPQANKAARNIIDRGWKTHGGKLALISGKAMLSALSGWAKERFNVSFGALRVARELQRDEIDSEAKSVVTAIERGRRMEVGLMRAR